MPRIVHFEIYADDVERAVKFYSELFGWEINKWEEGPPEVDYRLVNSQQREGEPGIDGAITQRPIPNMAGLNYIHIEAIDEYVEKVEAAGCNVFQPKMAVPGVGYIAIFTDTEGNSMGLFQSDPSAG